MKQTWAVKAYGAARFLGGHWRSLSLVLFDRDLEAHRAKWEADDLYLEVSIPPSCIAQKAQTREAKCRERGE
jgi:hypothetical protein